LYLAASNGSRAAVVLAASRGSGLDAVTVDRPKVMLPIAGKPLLRWLVDSFKKESVNDITVVGGYRADVINTGGIRLVLNERYAASGELASLACAMDTLSPEAETVISYGDLLFRSHVLRDLLETPADFAVVVDSSPTDDTNRTVRDFAFCSEGDDRGLFSAKVLLRRVSSTVPQSSACSAASDATQGRFIGLLKVSRAGLSRLAAVLERLKQRPDFDALDVPALLNALLADGAEIEVLYVHGHWRGVNDLEDFRLASDFAHGQTPLADAAGAAREDRGQ
ncbi:MAG: NTP transferase domain-containing protein, partial [Steroidobacteraceae bacterium]